VAADEQQSNWMIRLRGTFLNMDNKSDPVGGVGASDRISVNNKWIPELDVTYFIVPNIAAELVLTIPQKQDVRLDGAKIGTFSHLPPSLLLQYHFIPNGTFRPYVGAGVNVTRIWNADIAGNSLGLDRWSVGPALQIGMDYKVTRTGSSTSTSRRSGSRATSTQMEQARRYRTCSSIRGCSAPVSAIASKRQFFSSLSNG
jgi:outer membrane protein